MRMKSTRVAAALLVGVTLSLTAACSKVDESATDAGQEASVDTLAASLSEVEDLDTLDQAIEVAELGSVFDGPASYTLLAPDDEAFTKLGDRQQALMDEAQRPMLVALLRNHILPGHLTPESVEKAIAQKRGPVTMTTLGGETVRFEQDGKNVTVTSGSGSKALFAGTSVQANNGVIIPIDTVLLPAQES